MYDDHYGLSGRPFQLTPDPRFWFDTATHRKAMAYLGYGLSQGEGFVVITGDPGSGKTTLMGHLLGQIDRERMNVVKIVSTQLKPEDLLRLVSNGLDVDAGTLSKAAMLSAIEKGLHTVARAGKRTLLIVDEAQALPLESLEELRMLSNFQAGGYPLLQIFLLGQPEFRLRLQDPKLEQLRQRVIAMHHLDAMEADEVEPYLIHRLSCVGWRGKPRFTNDAVAAMYRWSGGSPRRLNQLASRVLLFGAIEQIDSFTAEDLATVTADLDSDTPLSSYVPAPPPSVAGPEPFELRDVAAPFDLRDPAAPFGLRDPAPMPISQPVQRAPVDPSPLRSGANDFGGSGDPALARRIAELETHLKEQDEALRRVLTLLVDWVETDGRKPDLSALRGNAA